MNNMEITLSPIAKLALVIFLIVIITIIVWLMVKNKIKLELGLIWLLSLITGSIVVLNENFLCFFTEKIIGGKQPATGLSVLAFMFIFILLISFSSIISDLTTKLKDLSQYVALLEHKLHRLERNSINNKASNNQDNN